MNNSPIASPKKKQPTIDQSEINPVGEPIDGQECDHYGDQNHHVVTEPRSIDSFHDHVDQIGDTQNHQNNPDTLPGRGIVEKLYDLLFHAMQHPCARVRLFCAYLLLASTHLEALAWFILTFLVVCAETYVIHYIWDCMARRARRTPLYSPVQFCRDIQLGGVCLSLFKDHALLLAVTSGLVVTGIYAQPLPPVSHPFFFGLFGLFGGFLLALAVTMEHLAGRVNNAPGA